MSKESYYSFYFTRFENNYSSIEPYTEINTTLFGGIEQLMSENIGCILFERFIASITLSNYIIESLLKIALIYSDSLHSSEEESIAAYSRYKNTALRSAIIKCFNKSIITADEKKHLENIVNDSIRNGFSHASYDKVIGEQYKIPAIMGNINSPLKQVQIDRRHYLSITESLMEQFAKDNAFEYYKFIFALIIQIEEKLKTE